MSQAPPRRFQTTRWSLVVLAGDADPEVRAAALSELLCAYLTPLTHYLISGLHVPPDRADDLLQSFVSEKVIEQQLVARAQRSRGKFRTFLLSALKQFIAGEFRRENRQKRMPGELTALDDIDEPVDERQAAPDEVFELSWARGVLDRAVGLMQQQCRASFRDDLWAVFQGRVIGPATAGAEPAPYEELVARLGLASAGEAQNLLVTGKRMFARVLRELIREYVESDAEVDEEIAALWDTLARCGRSGAGAKAVEPQGHGGGQAPEAGGKP